jgi:cell division protein FtsI/penicillin-binding protein 2
MVDNPKTYKTGSQTAAPVFKDVIEKTLEYYNIVPEILLRMQKQQTFL